MNTNIHCIYDLETKRLIWKEYQTSRVCIVNPHEI